MVLGGGAIGEYALGEAPRIKATNAIIESELLPIDAKKAIRDFIEETFKQAWNSIEELIGIDPPIELIDYWDIVIEILSKLL